MKTIGIIGIKIAEFKDWCKTRQYKRTAREKEYYDVYNDTHYIYIGNWMDSTGRQFDEVIDLDRFRQDLLYRLKPNGKYKILDYEFKRSR